METRNILFAAPLAFLVACGGSSGPGAVDAGGGGSAAFASATPSYAELSLDQQSTDLDGAALVLDADAPGRSAALQTAVVMQGSACHPHLFLRQREVVERVNRHIYKALRHVEALLAKAPLSSTATSRTWDDVDGGVERKFTLTLVSAGVYDWELDLGVAGTSPLPAVMTGRIDRTGATRPHQGKGTVHIDFAKLHAAYASEKVTTGTLDVAFDSGAGSRKLTVTAANVAWELDGSKFDSPAVLAALEAPRSGSYVYFREAGKGGSLKLQDQMVFACPANPSLVAANAQLVSRWTKVADGTVHGRSDALMMGGQLASPVDHVAAVTCHEGSGEGSAQREGFWLMKAESASGATLAGESSTHLGDASAQACDPVFGPVPTLTDGSADFTGWPTSYSDGTPFPFPGM